MMRNSTRKPVLPPPDACCGCSACVAACPVSAVVMRADGEGFLHPAVDERTCRGCSACVRACPVMRSPAEEGKPLAVFAAMSTDAALRRDSSSGGVFSLLARQVLLRGGSVFGAAVREGDLAVCHVEATDEDALARLRGSKYVQSNVGMAYADVQARLDAGRPVLFSGTPCQVAALKMFLGGPHENLLTVDVACHGVASPLAWQRYLDVRLSTCGWGRRTRDLNADGVHFRDKAYGWKNFSLSLRFRTGDVYSRTVVDDPYLVGFLSELYQRPSCHDCAFRGLRSGADITLADFWHVERSLADMDDDTGTSMVIVNSEQGRRAYDSVRTALRDRESCYADARAVNPALLKSAPPHPRRRWFFRLVGFRLVHFDLLTAVLATGPFSPYAWAVVKRTLKRLLFRGKGLTGYA